MKQWLKVLICFLAVSSRGEQLFFENFDGGEVPDGWTEEGRWKVSSEFPTYNTTPPAMLYVWYDSSPDGSDPYDHYMSSPTIPVGENTTVLVQFDFAFDGWPSEEHTNGMVIEYNGGNGWVMALSYEISPEDGETVDIPRRMESFYAENNGDLQLRFHAYGTNSYYIDSWVFDNIEVLSIPQLTDVSISSNNSIDNQKAIPGDIITLVFTVPGALSGLPYALINGTEVDVTHTSGNTYSANYTVLEIDNEGPITFSIDFTSQDGVNGATAKTTTDGTSVVIDVTGPPSPAMGENVNSIGGNEFSGIWNSTNTSIEVDVNVPQDSAVTSFEYEQGTSISFSGNNGFIAIPFDGSYQVSNTFTIEAWVKVSSSSNYQGFLDFGRDDAGGQKGFGFVYKDGGWRFYLKTTETDINYTNMVNASSSVNQWTHFAVTYENGVLKLYRNGIFIEEKDDYDGPVEWSGYSDDFIIGSFTRNGTTNYFDGSVDDVRFWNTVREEIQIKAMKGIALSGSEEGLLGYWKFDEGSGTIVGDETDTGNDGTRNNGATWQLNDSALDFQIPVYDTGVIVGSLFQMRAQIGGNGFEAIGPEIPVIMEDVNSGIKTINAPREEFELVTGFAQGEIAQFSAILTDQAGNSSTGDTSASTLEIDIVASQPVPTNIASDNTYPHLAKTGDGITISMTFDEDVDLPVVTLAGNATEESDLGNEEFEATYSLNGIEPEGDMEFTITVTDYLGNQSEYTTTTDGSNVYYDTTPPTLSPVIIMSNNTYDTAWAKVNDSISVTFNPSEEISADFALSFDGANDYLAIDNSTGIPSGNDTYTMAAWIKPSSMGTRGIIGWGGYGSSNRSNALRLLGGNQIKHYWWGNDLDVVCGELTDTWHYIVALYDGTTRKVFLDGNLLGSDTPNGHNAIVENFRIGSTNNGEYFHGLINEVSVWNIGLTQSQIQTIMNNGLNGNEEGLVGYWNFNEGSGSVAYDQSSNGNDGVLNNMDLTSAWSFERGSSPTVTIMGQDASMSTINSDQLRADYITTVTDPEGDVQFEITFADLAGNEGETVISTTNNSNVIFDRTAPADFTVGAVSTTGGNIVENVWNLTNTGFDVTIPIESDSTLDSGRVEIWAKVGSNAFEKLGLHEFIESNEVGGLKTISLIADSIEVLTGFTENDTVSVKANIYDRPGNETEGSESANKLLIDQTPPSMTSASYESNYSDSSLATVDHVITLMFEIDEPVQAPLVTISTQDASVSDLGNNNWQATYTMQESDNEGVIPFLVDTLTDVRGNPTEGFSSTTDGTQVVFDNTQPTLDSVSIVSNNSNSEWAKIGDSVTITSIAAESLMDQLVTIVNQTATIDNEGEDTFTATYAMSATDPEGVIEFEIIVTDLVGLGSEPVIETTDGTSVIFDRTAPVLDYVHIESNNANNPTIAIAGDEITLSFTSEEPLILDSIAVIISENIATVSESDGVYSAVMIMSGDEPSGNLTYTVDYMDRAGNPGIQVTTSTDDSYVNHDILPPEILYLSIASNNTDTSWAKVGDSIFVTFLASEVLDNIAVVIEGDSASYDNPSLAKYRGFYIMSDDDIDGEITFSISYTDLGGASGPDADTTTNNTEVVFDKTLPEFTSIRMVTNNLYGDTLAGIGTTDTLQFWISEPHRTIDVSLAGFDNVPTSNGLTFTSTHTFSGDEADGWVEFSLFMTDSAGNGSNTIMSTDSTNVRFDGTVPTLTWVNFASDNPNDSSLCIPGDSLFLRFITSETLHDQTIRIAGSPSDVTGSSDGVYMAVYEMTGTEPEGFIPFSIGFEDWVGNPGDTVEVTTDGTSVLFDMTPPDDFTLGAVVSREGVEVPGYWNASNEVLEIEIFIPDDETLPDGGFILQCSFDDTYSDLGDSVIIGIGDLDTNKTIMVSGTDFENVAGFVEDGNAMIQAIMWDKAGNVTTGSPSASTIHIDETLPNLISVSQSTNNAIGDSLAKVGDTDTLLFSSDEGLDSLKVQIFGQDAVVSGSNRTWIGIYTFQESDDDDIVSFNIIFGDTAGNLGSDVSGTTDGSWVRFDGTVPTLTWVNFASDNPNDSSLCIPGDSLFLRFITSETLHDQTIRIAGSPSDVTGSSDGVYMAVYEMTGTEPEGFIPFSIGFEDWVGNPGDTVEVTTDGTSVLFDMTPPDDFTLGAVVSREGVEVPGYWNASNEVLEIEIFIPDDETLPDGGFILQCSFDDTYSDLGDSVIIGIGDLDTNKTIMVSGTDFENVVGFVENGDATIRAIMWDKAGNVTTGSPSASTIHIDETTPTLSSVTIFSDNELGSRWAMVGNEVTLNFTGSEGLDSPLCIMTLDTLNATPDNNGMIWSAVRTVLEEDLEGIVIFNILFSDTAGNNGDMISESTNDTMVVLDRTNPVVSNLVEGDDEEEDIDYYNKSDTLTLFWEQNDSLSGIRDAYVSLGSDSQNTDILGWTLSSTADPFAGLGDLNLSNDNIYYGGVFARDSTGNLSDTIWGNGIYIDTELPDTGSIKDGYWIMDLDYAIDSTRLRYIWSNFSDNTEINHYEIAIGTGDDTTNIINWMATDSTDSMTVSGLSLERHTLYYSYIKAVDLATNESYLVRTDGVYFDDVIPRIVDFLPDVSDSAGFLSVINNDTITINFNRPIYSYNINVNSVLDSGFEATQLHTDSVINIFWADTLTSYDTLTVILDSAMAYNTLIMSDTLYFYSQLWGDLNNDYDITVQDILAFNQNWPETDLGPFTGSPPHVRPAPDGEVNLIDLAAFAKMWHWRYFNLDFDTLMYAARTTSDLPIKAKGQRVLISIPERASMAEILIGESNLDVISTDILKPSQSTFLFTALDTIKGMKQFSIADYRGLDTVLTLMLPKTDQEFYQAKIQYKFLDENGTSLSEGIMSANIEILPDKFMVYDNYPNPFNPKTTIRYDMPEKRNVTIMIYDILGRSVRSIILDQVQGGRHQFTWHGTNDFGKKVSTGIYFLQLTAGQDTKIQKMLLLK